MHLKMEEGGGGELIHWVDSLLFLKPNVRCLFRIQVSGEKLENKNKFWLYLHCDLDLEDPTFCQLDVTPLDYGGHLHNAKALDTAPQTLTLWRQEDNYPNPSYH